MQVVPTIICGGAGSRLWPVSREQHPKPFIRLADGQTLLQKAYLRSALPGVTQVLTVTNRDFAFKIKDEFQEAGGKLASAFILEPFGRGTAAAIACAALQVEARHGPGTIMLILTADHLIEKQAAFAAAVQSAAELAASGRLVAFGIRPDRPETGYGYIQARGDEIERFVEKPTVEKAREYIAAGYLWNSGMFCFAAGTVISEMARHCPSVLAAVRACLARSSEGPDGSLELDPETFAKVPDISFDYAVMEKSKLASVVPGDLGWSDIGSWSAIADLVSADAKGNRVEGDAVLHGATDCYVRAEDRIVAAVGVENLLIVDTRDALLVADKAHAQDVKHVFAHLKGKGLDAAKLHPLVHRPWGTYEVLEEGAGFKIKRIEVKAGASLSLQMHHHRSEHWIVVNGTAKVVNGDREFLLQANESTFIPAENRHRLENPTANPLVIIEVQCGGYLGEDDIVRFEDRYGRVREEAAADPASPVARR